MKLDKDSIGYLNLFEKVTHVSPKHCFVDKNDILIFIVPEGTAGKAIGKKATNVLHLSSLFKKRLRIIEYSADPCKFVQHCLAPLKADSVTQKDEKVVITCQLPQTKAKILGRDKANLKALQALVKPYFPAVDIVVE